MVLTGSAAADGIVVFCQQSFVQFFFSQLIKVAIVQIQKSQFL